MANRMLAPEELERTLRLAESGMTKRGIARILGISRQQVNRRLKAMGGGAEEPTIDRPRCPRCFLSLPCNSCLPSIYAVAASRRGDAAGMVK